MLQTAVLFLVFNRPDTTHQVMQAIRAARPSRLYVAQDGPRAQRPGEAERVQRVRTIALEVDWPCEVKTLFRDQNLGCRRAISSAVDWFFTQEEQGIVLEDDCLPHADFFGYCEALLERYKNDSRVGVITGCNFQDGIQRGAHSYYFSRFNHVWGWASWRRAWQHNDTSLSFWPDFRDSQAWRDYWRDPVVRQYFARAFDDTYRGEVDTWDYQWTASVWWANLLTATPQVNLISNIGFGPEATRTKEIDPYVAARPVQGMGALRHPDTVEWSEAADRYTFDHAFGGRHRRFPGWLLHLPRRIGAGLARRLGAGT